MRKALYWDLHNPDPQKALKFYKEALRKVEEIGMDPFSKEVLGIKIQLASLFERYHNYNKAIEVLEIVRRDCYAWVEKLGGIHMTDGKRTRVLGQAAAMGVKLGELYSLPYVDDQEAAEAALVTAVETMLKEKRGERKRASRKEKAIGRPMKKWEHHSRVCLCLIVVATNILIHPSTRPPLRQQRQAPPLRAPLPQRTLPLSTKILSQRNYNEQPCNINSPTTATTVLHKPTTGTLENRRQIYSENKTLECPRLSTNTRDDALTSRVQSTSNFMGNKRNTPFTIY